MMKKLTLCIATVLLLFTLIPTQLKAVADNDPAAKPSTETVMTAETIALLARIDEIKDMDKSNLTSAQKKDLRKELRQIKQTLALTGPGIYLSVGALILVIVLLVLLL